MCLLKEWPKSCPKSSANACRRWLLDSMGKFLMPRIRGIQRNDSYGAEYLTEDCMPNLASSSSDGKADGAMRMASGSGPRTCLSCSSLAFHIPLSHAFCAIVLSGPSGSGRAITFGPEVHCLHDSCLSKTVAWARSSGASFTLEMKISPPSAQSSGLEESAVTHGARLRGSSDLTDRCRPRCQMLQLRGGPVRINAQIYGDLSGSGAVRWPESSRVQ